MAVGKRIKEAMMDIDKMEAGREMDALVAEKVMGYEVYRHEYSYHDTVNEFTETEYIVENIRVPSYSTDISAAWQVVEKLNTDSPFDKFDKFSQILAEGCDADQDDYIADCYNLLSGISPLAICRAALKAVDNG